MRVMFDLYSNWLDSDELSFEDFIISDVKELKVFA